jgi:hypothetical protein
MREELQEKLVLGGFVLIGLAQLALHPRKTYNLVVHKVGWHN